jgi:hypothetical protein
MNPGYPPVTTSDERTRVKELVEWALPIQERHLRDVRQGSLSLAAEEDPNA